MRTCRSCGAEVLFVPSATTGKAMILDARPERRVLVQNQRAPGRSEMPGATGAVARVIDAYTDHHVTCPDAAAWKGRTRRQAS